DINLAILSTHGQLVAWVIHRNSVEHGVVIEENELILELGKKIVGMLSFHGIIHFDIRIDERDRSIKILECNPRIWGSMIDVLYTGVNFIQLAMDASNSNFHFKGAVPGTYSLKKSSLLRKLTTFSLNLRDVKTLIKRLKYYRFDPYYEFVYFCSLIKLAI